LKYIFKIIILLLLTTFFLQATIIEKRVSSNNDMVFIITGTGKRVAESYDGSANKAPLLHIEYGEETKDFGDVPNTYTHVSHEIDENLYLGNSVPDGETNQQSSNHATGDGDDDNDGVVGVVPTLTVGDSSYTPFIVNGSSVRIKLHGDRGALEEGAVRSSFIKAIGEAFKITQR